MPIELYYNNVPIRLLALLTLSLLVSFLYFMYLKDSNEFAFLKQEKHIYGLQIVYWILFLSNNFDRLLPTNYIGFFTFELITIVAIFITFIFLLWNLFTKKKLNYLLLLFSLPMVILFILALGMD